MAAAQPTLASVRSHRVPAWYREAGLGIFIHWGIASVPGWAPRERDIHELLRTRYRDAIPLSPYTEWYENALRFEWSPTARWHREHYGDRSYASFRADFERGLSSWNPAAWAAHFAAAGARYVVMVTKHHDGYCLWPSDVPNPARPGWHAPRDLVGELAEAVRIRGLRFGAYYSGGIDWSFNSTPIRTPGAFIASVPDSPYPAYADAQVRELIQRYAPDVLWNDISWPGDRPSLVRLWADYYDAVPEGVVNDRWLERGWLVRALRTRIGRTLADAAAAWHFRRGARLLPARPLHADTRTPEYAAYDSPRSFAWECVRGMDKSFGYNRASHEEDFITRDELRTLLATCRRNGGNLLLNVGPRGEDGGIPEPQLRRLGWLAESGP